MADFFGSDCLIDDKMSEETYEICKALMTNSWMRTNTKARQNQPKLQGAWNDKEAAKIAERNNYPRPIVDHAAQRKKALDMFKRGLGRETA